jgi:NAD(P)-dependent dehydrogenase (short-subunit alcohol dehydrogenase family)
MAGRVTARISLEGKVAIITGASRGIGEAMARAFAASGASVVLAARKPDALQEVARSIGERALAVPTHTGKESDCSALVAKAVERFGKVDVLVNNAATNPYFGPLLGIDMGAWDKTFEVNLKGYFYMAREVARHLQARDEKKGSIIHVTSVNGLEAAPLQGVYGMTKAAVISMTKTMAYELASSNIRVNAIAPGLVDTRFASAIVSNDEIVATVVKKTPLGRYAVPDEIAGAAVYLASDASSFTTGHTLVVDGGLTIS